jgi:histidine triad (HIT) family protein
MASVFTMIINGDLPGHFLWKDDQAVAFLSINPTNRGHALVVPRYEVDHWVELPTSLNQHLMAVAHHVATVQQELYKPARVGLLVAGFEVPHVHVHVIPIDTMGNFDLTSAATEVDHGELAKTAAEIREALLSNGHVEAQA